MTVEQKLARAAAREHGRNREIRRRRNLGRQRQLINVEMSKAEFEKRYPHLPLKAWYIHRRFTGYIGYDDEYDDEFDRVIPKSNPFLPSPSTC